MSSNEQDRQREITAALAARARALAHSSRTVVVPADSYGMLADLVDATTSLGQVCRQLGAWHAHVVAGVAYERGDGATGTVTAAAELDRAVAALEEASVALLAAHAANGTVRWAATAR